ncbi:hypothetical protein [Phenylobacterium sp.]|nr:hypothetical protein [Phenylobacterium sp.]
MMGRTAALGTMILLMALAPLRTAAAAPPPPVEARKVAGLAAPAEIRIDR